MNETKEQWERVLRLRGTLDELEQGSEAYNDSLIILFQQLLNLRDWVAGEKGTPLNDTVHSFASSTKELRICKAIANGTKHLIWKPNSSKPELLSIRFGTTVWNSTGSMVADNEPDDVGTRSMLPERGYWIVNRDNESVFDAVELADICIMAWRAFLNDTGLIWD